MRVGHEDLVQIQTCTGLEVVSVLLDDWYVGEEPGDPVDVFEGQTQWLISSPTFSVGVTWIEVGLSCHPELPISHDHQSRGILIFDEWSSLAVDIIPIPASGA